MIFRNIKITMFARCIIVQLSIRNNSTCAQQSVIMSVTNQHVEHNGLSAAINDHH